METSASDLQSQVAKRLKRARRALGKKQVDVANQLGVDKSLYNKYESGVSRIPQIHMATLDRKFGISPDYLILDRRGSCSSDVKDALAKQDAKDRKSTSVSV